MKLATWLGPSCSQYLHACCPVCLSDPDIRCRTPSTTTRMTATARRVQWRSTLCAWQSCRPPTRLCALPGSTKYAGHRQQRTKSPGVNGQCAQKLCKLRSENKCACAERSCHPLFLFLLLCRPLALQRQQQPWRSSMHAACQLVALRAWLHRCVCVLHMCVGTTLDESIHQEHASGHSYSSTPHPCATQVQQTAGCICLSA